MPPRSENADVDIPSYSPTMKAICGFFRLDGKPADALQLAAMRAVLVHNSSVNSASFEGHITGSAGLGAAEWSRAPIDGAEPSLHHDAESGCLAVVDAHLDERDILARRLGLIDTAARATQAELILKAYLRWGEQCPAELYGDFAFAVWDPRQQRLFCARDIMGVRPLYVHHQTGKLFAFASHAQALLALPDVPKDLNEGRIADFLVDHLEGMDRTSTFYRVIERLPPAHSLTTDPSRSQQQRYWRLQPGLIKILPTTDAQWAEALTAVLENTVRNHLAGNERVGCMVSGGLDSSSLAVIAKDQLAAAGKPALPTFSSVDNNPACLETRAIRAMLNLSGFAPTTVGPDQFDAMRAEIANAVWHSRRTLRRFDGAAAHPVSRRVARRCAHAVMDGIDGDVLLSESGGLVRQLRSGQWRKAWRNARGNQRIYSGEPAWKELGLAARNILTPDWLRKAAWQRRTRTGLHARQFVRSTLISRDFAERVNLAERLQRHADVRASNIYDMAAHSVAQLEPIYTTCGMERYHRVASWHGVDPLAFHIYRSPRARTLCEPAR